MFGHMRSPFEDIFNFQREADQIFNRFWNELPARSTRPASNYPFHVHASSDTWRLDVPMPGIDPKDVVIEVSGSTVSIRAEHTGGSADGEMHYQQTMTVPQFLEVERLTAHHRHGMLELTIPLKESVKPRRIQVSGAGEPQKQVGEAQKQIAATK